jgi:outer membrane protein
MKHRSIATAVGLALAGALLGLSNASRAANLDEVYQRALSNDPQIREAEANRMASLEGKPEALSALLPQLNANGSYVRDEASSKTPEIFSNPSVGNPNAVATPNFYVNSKTDITNWQLQLRQTIFRWDQIAALKQANVKVAQAEVDFHAAQQDLILRTAQRYFAVLSAKDALDAAESSHEAIARQLDQAEQRYGVGLIAITDVQEARAAADNAAATVIAAKRSLATAEEELRELTGETFPELTKPGDDMPLVNPEPANEDQWVRAALDQNLQLTSARLGADIASENIAIARAGHFPTLDLVAGKTGSNTTGDQTQALSGGGLPTQVFPLTANANSSDKQIGLQVTVPIFAGGGTSARVREAVYRQRAAREHLELTARETERATRNAYLGVVSDISHVKALRQALESAEVALKATDAGYEVGTRTAVDVLLARQRLFQAQSDYLKSRYDYVVDVLTLEQAAGTLDATRLGVVNGWLSQSVRVR